MTKQISSILCLSLLAAALASCGSEGTESPIMEEQTTAPVHRTGDYSNSCLNILSFVLLAFI